MKKKRVTLRPLAFEEAVADILKVKPEPKQPKKRGQPGKIKRKAAIDPLQE